MALLSPVLVVAVGRWTPVMMSFRIWVRALDCGTADASDQKAVLVRTLIAHREYRGKGGPGYMCAIIKLSIADGPIEPRIRNRTSVYA